MIPGSESLWFVQSVRIARPACTELNAGRAKPFSLQGPAAAGGGAGSPAMDIDGRIPARSGRRSVRRHSNVENAMTNPGVAPRCSGSHEGNFGD